MRKTFFLNRNGMSMVEVMISTVIFMFIAATLYAGLLVANKTWNVYKGELTVQREARLGMIRMTTELREATGLSVSSSSDEVTISFNRPNHGSITYNWSTSGNNANIILRTDSVATSVIARGITFFSASETPSSITLELTATDNSVFGPDSTLNLREKVVLRQG